MAVLTLSLVLFHNLTGYSLFFQLKQDGCVQTAIVLPELYEKRINGVAIIQSEAAGISLHEFQGLAGFV